MTESEFQDQQANVLMRQKEWERKYITPTEHLPPYEDGPWEAFDRVCGWVVSIFAAIGFSVTVGVLIGFIWGYFK